MIINTNEPDYIIFNQPEEEIEGCEDEYQLIRTKPKLSRIEPV